MARGTRAPDRSLNAPRAYEPAAAPRHAAARRGAVQHQRHRRAPLADHGGEPVRTREPGIVAGRDGGLLPALGDRRTGAQRHRSGRGGHLSVGAARLRAAAWLRGGGGGAGATPVLLSIEIGRAHVLTPVTL